MIGLMLTERSQNACGAKLAHAVMTGLALSLALPCLIARTEGALAQQPKPEVWATVTQPHPAVQAAPAKHRTDRRNGRRTVREPLPVPKLVEQKHDLIVQSKASLSNQLAPQSGELHTSAVQDKSPAISTSPAAIVDADKLLAKVESPATSFCGNLMSQAHDARAAHLQRTIASLEDVLAEKTKNLEARIAEHKEWVEKRLRLAAQADKKLVEMYARMRPDAAGQRMTVMDEPLAASVLMKLEDRISSAIMSEIPPEKAAKIASVIAIAADVRAQQPQIAAASAGARNDVEKRQ